MTLDPVDPPASPRPLWRRPAALLLAASLVANVFLGAALMGRGFGGPGGRDGLGGPGGGELLARFAREAPPELRDAAERVYATRRAEMRAMRGEVRAALRALRDQMTAEPFDPAAFAAAQAALREAGDRRRRAAEAGVAEIVGLMDADARRALAERMERRWRERRGGGRDDERPEDR